MERFGICAYFPAQVSKKSPGQRAIHLRRHGLPTGKKTMLAAAQDDHGPGLPPEPAKLHKKLEKALPALLAALSTILSA